MRDTFILSAVIICLSLTGCAVHRRIEAYQVHATKSCLKHHTAEECKPLDYPACENSGFGTVCR